jgi:hypothetical protein
MIPVAFGITGQVRSELNKIVIELLNYQTLQEENRDRLKLATWPPEDFFRPLTWYTKDGSIRLRFTDAVILDEAGIDQALTFLASILHPGARIQMVLLDHPLAEEYPKYYEVDAVGQYTPLTILWVRPGETIEGYLRVGRELHQAIRPFYHRLKNGVRPTFDETTRLVAALAASEIFLAEEGKTHE